LVFFSLSLADSPVKEAESSNSIKANVEGMVCDFCAQGIKKLFKKREEVLDINIDLDSGTVLLNLKKGQDISDEELKKIITSNGISVISIDRSGK
jgi:copper chaperone CopZ